MKWSVLTVPLVILMDILMIINYNTYRQAEFDSLNQRAYDIQINYACDAALQEAMLQAMDSGLDYKDVYAIKLEPDAALDTYVECMLRSLNWSITDENKQDFLQEHTPFFIVAETDGIYCYGRVLDNTSYELNTGTVVDGVTHLVNMWTPKMPYVTADSENIYIYSMSDEYYVKYNKAQMKFIDNVPYLEGNGKGTIVDKNKVVATTLNKVINNAILCFEEGDIPYIFNLPMNDTIYVQAPKSPGIYVMVYDKNTLTKEPLIAVGGARVQTVTSYIAYERMGNKFYTYAHNRKEVEELGCSILEVFSSAKQAAQAGYYPDVYFR